MGLFRRKALRHSIRLHPDNIASKDWLILLEANTIIGPSPERLRVARTTLERSIVRKYNIMLKAEHFLVVKGYLRSFELCRSDFLPAWKGLTRDERLQGQRRQQRQ
jgi:hypothetical protein